MIHAALQTSEPGLSPTLSESHVLGMAEMGYRGLSEQWLMRRAGDLHWQLIAQGMGQGADGFTCADGLPLYAAFCLTSLRIDAPQVPRLGATARLSARLWRVKRSRLVSEQMIEVGGQTIGSIRLISTFVGHDVSGSNRAMVRRMPRVLACPPEAPARLATLAARGAALARRLGSQRIVPSQMLMPCPATDFNAAGLLYFPSFAALFDRADHARGAGWDRWLTARDTLYCGNADPGEVLGITLAPRGPRTAGLMSGEGGRVVAAMRADYRA